MWLNSVLVIVFLSAVQADFVAEPVFDIQLADDSFLVSWDRLPHAPDRYHIHLKVFEFLYSKISLSEPKGSKRILLENPCWEWQIEVHETIDEESKLLASSNNEKNLGYVRNVEFWPLPDSVLITWDNVSMCIPDELVVNVKSQADDVLEYKVSSSDGSLVVHPSDPLGLQDVCFSSVFQNTPSQEYTLCEKDVVLSHATAVYANLQAYLINSRLLVLWESSECVGPVTVISLVNQDGFTQATLYADRSSVGYFIPERLSQNVRKVCIYTEHNNEVMLAEMCTIPGTIIANSANALNLTVTNRENSFDLQWERNLRRMFLIVVRENQVIQVKKVTRDDTQSEVNRNGNCAFYQFFLLSSHQSELLGSADNAPMTLQIANIQSYRIDQDVLVKWETQGLCTVQYFNVTLRDLRGEESWYHSHLYSPGAVFADVRSNLEFYVEVSALDESNNLRVNEAKPIVYKMDHWNVTLKLLDSNSFNIMWNPAVTSPLMGYQLIWFQNNIYKGIHEIDPVRTNFTFNNVDLCHSYDFSLHGTDQAGVQFTLGQVFYVGGKPSLTFKGLETQVLRLDWSIPSECEPQRIRVYVEQNKQPWKVDTQLGGDKSVAIDGAQLCTNYEFRIIMQHQDGSERVSDPLSVTTFPENTLKPVPMVQIMKDGSVLVSWTARPGCNVTLTKILLNELGVGVEEYVISGEDSEIVILDAKPCSFYHVQLKIVYASGYVEDSVVVAANTFTTQFAPVMLSSYILDNQTRIRWDPSNTCNVLSYRLDVVDTKTGQVQIYADTKTSVNVPIDSATTLYQVTVSSLSPFGQTQLAPMQPVWPGRVPKKPSAPNVTAEGNYVKVHWNNLDVDHSIHSHKVTVFRPGKSVKHWIVPTKQNFLILEDVASTELPSFSIRAINQYGESQSSEVVQF
ncbi:fibronectin type III domain-containing protein 3B [Clonorchis sinensis]|uniref:Fibronectin type III domain-containing protein 3B n=1 Tax=Clonorchis sinensis TaxID=79923 RepID=G7YQA0_CLOSI|nr:fibronectin type III domain-containing protein 3B [Clonorchis sinensis]